MFKPDVVVCFSGGMDSTVLAESAYRAGRLQGLIFFRYGQPHMTEELRAARAYSKRRSVELAVIDLPNLGGAMNIGIGASGARVVPGRNLLMLAAAIAHTQAMNGGVVWYGANADDVANYPDCRPDFLKGVQIAATAYGIAVAAPLMQITKHEVATRYRTFGLRDEDSWSCYQPHYENWDAKPCGTCDACRLRSAALIGVE